MLVTDHARIDVTLDSAPYTRIQRWHFFHVKPGSTILRLRLARPLAPGVHRLYWKATAESDHAVRRTSTPLRVLAHGAKAHAAHPAQIVASLGGRPLRAPASASVNVRTGTVEQAVLYATYHDVAVFVVDADLYGAPSVATLRTVFPTTRVVVLSKRASLRARLTRLGALALPSSTPAAQLAALVARLAG